MATITVNIQERVEQMFRKRVYQLYGKRKGMLGKALAEAMQEWVEKKKNFEICISMLENGVDMGKIKYTNREELYDRN